jgi:hypothetical protein
MPGIEKHGPSWDPAPKLGPFPLTGPAETVHPITGYSKATPWIVLLDPGPRLSGEDLQLLVLIVNPDCHFQPQNGPGAEHTKAANRVGGFYVGGQDRQP